jgi:amino acid transporter
MIGFSFSIVTCWTALGGVLIVGIESGGPPVMVYSWIAVCFVTLAVAYSFAEMCSAYPVAGGQYSWVAVLAPPRYARGLSFVTGWFMITGIVSMGAVNNFIGKLAATQSLSFVYHFRQVPISCSAWRISRTPTTSSSASTPSSCTT